jgi:hypothetical protein
MSWELGVLSMIINSPDSGTQAFKIDNNDNKNYKYGKSF